MSRIFNALSRTGEEYGEILSTIREHETEPGKAQPSGAASTTPLKPEIVALLAQRHGAEIPKSGNGTAHAASLETLPEIRPAAAPRTQVEPAAAAEDVPPVSLSGFRTIHIRIPRTVPVLPFDGVHEAAGEEYRMIRGRIVHHALRPRVILVSSPNPGDGKTITALNIAGALALKGTSDVLLIDGDFARSSLSAITGIPTGPGLGEVLNGRARLEDAIIQVEQFPHLHFLTAGQSTANPAELLDRPVWTGLVETLRARFGYVVFDSPPVEAVPYYGRLLAASDGVVLVARPDHTKRPHLAGALSGIPEEKLVGVVLNCQAKWFLNKQSDSYNRYYAASQD
jgi:capsular exopolysaccharide synthesis family protein